MGTNIIKFKRITGLKLEYKVGNKHNRETKGYWNKRLGRSCMTVKDVYRISEIFQYFKIILANP